MILRLNTKAESDAATVTGTVVIGVTVAADTAEDVAVIAVRRTKPPGARACCTISSCFRVVIVIISVSTCAFALPKTIGISRRRACIRRIECAGASA